MLKAFARLKIGFGWLIFFNLSVAGAPARCVGESSWIHSGCFAQSLSIQQASDQIARR